MNFIGNFLWLIFGGLILSLCWFIIGLLWCITIIGIPVGIQCFKIAELALCPFGRTVEYGGGAVSFLLNILWIIFGGLELAVTSLIIGIILSITIVGIPFGIQCFKLAKLSLMPFSATIK